MSNQQRLHATVHGHVQGVSFRYNTLLEANRLRVAGWVRNRPEGTVEVLAEGDSDALLSLLDFLNSGPVGAHVSFVDHQFLAATGEFAGFTVR